MSEDEDKDSITSPPGNNPSEATSPPGNGDLDEDALKKGEDKLGEAGAGH